MQFWAQRFEVLSISLEKKNIVRKISSHTPKTLGSGGAYADQILFAGYVLFYMCLTEFKFVGFIY